MMTSWMRKPATLGLSLGATLMAAVFGCGGQAHRFERRRGRAGQTASSSPAGKPSTTPQPGRRRVRRTRAVGRPRQQRRPSRPRGSAPSRDRSSSQVIRRLAKVLFEKGKAAKDPEVCAKDAPLLSERLVVDGAHQGRQECAGLSEQANERQRRGQEGRRRGHVMFDQNKCVFDPHVLGILNGTPITLKSSDPVNHNVNAKLKKSAFNQLLAPQSRPSSPPPVPSGRPAKSPATFIPG